MEKHKCKICLRSFNGGRALGGHMRSHIVNHFSHSNSEKDESEDIFSIQSSSSSKVKENPDFHNGESESECSQRAIQVPKIRTKFKEQESISLLSEKSPDEEIAYCLMLLKRDCWSRKKVEPESKLQEAKRNISTKVKVKYKCDTCYKVFKTYQALGGHRASHKKGSIAKRGSRTEERESRERSPEKTHQCPVCLKGFSSGQALGGHKRSHLSGLEVTYPGKKINNIIDLNLPPPIDDGNNVDDMSQIVSHS